MRHRSALGTVRPALMDPAFCVGQREVRQRDQMWASIKYMSSVNCVALEPNLGNSKDFTM